MEQKGIEPSSIDCRSTVLAIVTTAPFVHFLLVRVVLTVPVESKGLEPSVSCVQGRCFSQLSYDPIVLLFVPVTMFKASVKHQLCRWRESNPQISGSESVAS